MPDMQQQAPLEQLEKQALEIPSMGGRSIGGFLQKAVLAARPGTNIIEIGAWLGAGTAQLAIGALKRTDSHRLQIHTYDRFQATAIEAQRACSKGVALSASQDTLPVVQNLLSGFGGLIHFHKTDLNAVAYPEKKLVSVYVDDAAKTPGLFTHMLKTFSPYWIPGETVLVLMDFFYYAKRPDSSTLQYQKFIVDNNPGSFTLIEDYSHRSSIAAFRYEQPLCLTALDRQHSAFQETISKPRRRSLKSRLPEFLKKMFAGPS